MTDLISDVAKLAPGLLMLIAAIGVFFSQAIRILREYERGVIFRLGKLLGAKGPGLIILIPVVDRMVKMDLRVVTIDVSKQEIMTRDNVPATVDAVVYFRVVDPIAAVIKVENFWKATSLIAQTTLRSVLGQAPLDDLLSQRDVINQKLQEIIDRQTEPWGVKVTAVEVKDVSLPDSMKRAMAKQAEAERERRAKIELRPLLDRLQKRPVKPHRRVAIEGLAHERRVFSAAPMPSVNERTTETASSAPSFPPTIGLLGNNAQVEQFIATAALLGSSAVVCGDRSGIFTLVAESASRGFITPLEAEQVRIRVRASDNLDGFENAGLVFVADGHNAFRLAAAVRPRTVVCVVCPTGRDPIEANSRLAVPFPFPRLLVRISFCESDRVALFPDPATDPETVSTLAVWFRHLGYTSLVFPVAARLLPRAA
jgi:hypothetical protein